MGKLTKTFTAYAIATAAFGAVGAVSAELARAWLGLPNLDSWQVIGALWLVGPGRLSAAWASDYLAAQLGVKKPIEIRAAGLRRIPISATWLSWLMPGSQPVTLADSAVGMWGVRPQPRRATLDVAEGITLERKVVDGNKTRLIVADETMIDRFVTGGYRRQQAGQHPFTRKYWVTSRPPKITREHYELILDVLQAHNLVVGRRQGADGQLICEPRHVLTELRHYSPIVNNLAT